MKRIFWIMITFLLLSSWHTVAAQSAPLPEAAYWMLIDEASESATLEERKAIAAKLETVEAVLLANGEQVTVDTSYLESLLLDEDLSSSELGHVFEALVATQSEASLDISSPEALAALESILGRSEYEYQSVVPEWLTRIFELLVRGIEFLFRIFEISVENGTASTIGWVIAAFAVLGLLGFLWYWLRGVRHQFSSESELEAVDEDGNLISAEAAFDQAETLANQSDYRQAVRFLYLSTLLSLDERGLLRYDRSKTNREYLRMVAGSEVSSTLSSVVDVFDRVWYGFQPIDAASYAQYADAVRRLRKA